LRFFTLGFVWNGFTAHDSNFSDRFGAQYPIKLPLGAATVQCYASSLMRPLVAWEGGSEVGIRNYWTRFGLILVASSISTAFHLAAASSQQKGGDPMSAAVDLFLQARTSESDVEARKLMTAHLEDQYLHDKRLSVRVRSGRLVAYNFEPSKISSSGDKEFVGRSQ
jgi:hypothetical protein